MSADRDSRAQLLARAARCYRSAGQELDACRCLVQAGDFSAAGFIHEQAKRWGEAADCFEHARQWPLAARCFLAAGLPLDAARNHLTAGNPLEAAWVLAHHAHQFERARAALAGFTAQGAEQEIALLLALARCAAPRKGAEAGRLLRQTCARLGELNENHNRVMTWAYALSHEVLDRPDLTMELMTAAWNAGIDTRDRWERWAKQRLGSADGIGLLMAIAEGEAP